MDEANSSSQENYEFLARVSWLAYLKQFFWTLLLAFGLFLAALLVTSIAGMTEEVAAITAEILALLWLLYNFWYLNSIMILTVSGFILVFYLGQKVFPVLNGEILMKSLTKLDL